MYIYIYIYILYTYFITLCMKHETIVIYVIFLLHFKGRQKYNSIITNVNDVIFNIHLHNYIVFSTTGSFE